LKFVRHGWLSRGAARTLSMHHARRLSGSRFGSSHASPHAVRRDIDQVEARI